MDHPNLYGFNFELSNDFLTKTDANPKNVLAVVILLLREPPQQQLDEKITLIDFATSTSPIRIAHSAIPERDNITPSTMDSVPYLDGNIHKILDSRYLQPRLVCISSSLIFILCLNSI